MSPNHSWLTALAVVAIALSPALPSAGAADLAHLEQQAMQAAVDRVAESVVRIQSVGGTAQVEGVTLGEGPCTGLVVSPDGLIISSRFNFARQPTSILVELPEGGPLAARLLGTDTSRGLVLLKVDLPEGAAALTVPAVAPVEAAVPGAWALAIGRALDVRELNLSVGVVSAIQRIWGKAIQTDAKVSPSNYGGPLVDIHGRVLGLLVPLSPAREGDLAGSEWYDSGIGFAIPYAYIQKVLPRLRAGENLRPGFMGLSLRGDGNLFGIPPQVQATHPDSPAAQAGLQVDDKILAVDGMAVTNIAQLKYQIKPRFAGDQIRLTVLRKEEQRTHELSLAEESGIRWIEPRPEAKQQQQKKSPLPKPKKGRDPLDRI